MVTLRQANQEMSSIVPFPLAKFHGAGAATVAELSRLKGKTADALLASLIKGKRLALASQGVSQTDADDMLLTLRARGVLGRCSPACWRRRRRRMTVIETADGFVVVDGSCVIAGQFETNAQAWRVVKAKSIPN